MLKKALSLVICLAMFNLGMAYAFDGNSCISCSEENMQLIESMGFTVEETPEGLMVTNSYTGETRVIAARAGGACTGYTMCLWITFWVAYGIFFIPCLIGYFSTC